MTLTVDVTVHTVRRLPLVGEVMLPRLDVDDHRPGLIDLIGSTIRDRGVLILAGAVIGAIVGTVTSAGVVAATLLGAAAGFALGMVRSQAVGLSLGPYRSDHVEVPEVRGETLRVLEYNVHGGMGGPGKFLATPRTLDHLAATIRAAEADIVLLQELDDFALRSTMTDTLGQLVKRLHPTGAVMTPAAEKVYGRREGTGILTFSGITISDARGLRIPDAFGDSTARRFRSAAAMWSGIVSGWLGRRGRMFASSTEYQPRAATDALICTPTGNRIRVLSGHFSSPHDGVDEPARQVAPILETVPTWAGPTIVGADFNVRDGSAEFDREHEMCTDVGLSEATAGAPPNSDRIYASAHFDAIRPQKLPPLDGEPPASDHSPVVVDLTLRP